MCILTIRELPNNIHLKDLSYSNNYTHSSLLMKIKQKMNKKAQNLKPQITKRCQNLEPQITKRYQRCQNLEPQINKKLLINKNSITGGFKLVKQISKIPKNIYQKTPVIGKSRQNNFQRRNPQQLQSQQTQFNSIQQQMLHPQPQQQQQNIYQPFLQDCNNAQSLNMMNVNSQQNQMFGFNSIHQNKLMNQFTINQNNIEQQQPQLQLNKQIYNPYCLFLYQMIMTQNKQLGLLKQSLSSSLKNQYNLIQEVKSLKTLMKEENIKLINKKENESIEEIEEEISNKNQCSNKERFLNLYFPVSQFKYKLVLWQDIDLPLYKDRNFNVSLKLIDQWGNLTINPNRIKVEMQIFTKEYKPRKLLLNNLGDKIIRRNHQSVIINGFACFSKVQINAVTSHFPYGQCFFVIRPQKKFNQFIPNRLDDINISDIQPLVLDNLVVKAKKMKVKKEENKQEK